MVCFCFHQSAAFTVCSSFFFKKFRNHTRYGVCLLREFQPVYTENTESKMETKSRRANYTARRPDKLLEFFFRYFYMNFNMVFLYMGLYGLLNVHFYICSFHYIHCNIVIIQSMCTEHGYFYTVVYTVV